MEKGHMMVNGGVRWACKPGSVSQTSPEFGTSRDGDHLSSPSGACKGPESPLKRRDDVTIGVKRPTRGWAGRPISPYLALLQVGFDRRCVTAVGRELLPRVFTLIPICPEFGINRDGTVSVSLSVSSHPRTTGPWALPSTLPSGARTFLPDVCRSGHPAHPTPPLLL